MGKSETRMDDLAKKRFKIWREVVTVGDFVRGSVVVLRRPCTRENCRLCREGKRHPATYLSMKEKGRTQLVYLSKKRVAQARQWVREWKRLAKLLQEMSKTNAEVLRLLGKRDSAERRRKR
jgi:hypothetical protein